MKLDDVLASLFPSGHQVERGPSGTLHGTAKVDGQADLTAVRPLGSTVRSCWPVMSSRRWERAAARRSSFSSIRRARIWRVGTNCWGSTNT